MTMPGRLKNGNPTVPHRLFLRRLWTLQMLMPSIPQNGQTGDIKITSEMIQAGLREFTFYERGADDGAECIREIYTAMEEARLRGGDKATRRVG